MATLMLQFLVAASVIVFAGTFLTRYGDAIGERTGMGRSLAGLLLLATATSLPELSVDCNLARNGAADIALGDLLGSSLFNLLILAILDLLHRAPQKMFSHMAAAHALSATMSISLTVVCLLAMTTRFSGTLWGIGPGPVALVLVYLLGLRLVFYDQRFATAQQSDIRPTGTEHGSLPTLGRAVFGFLAAAGVIFVAAPRLAVAAEGLAEETGLGGSFVGTVLVALSTSLPEFVTSMAAVRSGAFDLAVGNIFGSNSFNMLILLPVDYFYDGSLLGSAALVHVTTAGCVILVTSIAMAGILYRAEKRYLLLEPDATLVIALVLASFGTVFALG
jgi:cation:H+ antiporter